MLDLKFKVMLICIGSEADFLDNGFGGIGLDFLFLFPLIVEELVEFNDPADRWVGIWGDHDQVLAHIFSPVANCPGRVDAGLNFSAGYLADIIEVVSDEPYFRHSDISIDLKFVFVWF